MDLDSMTIGDAKKLAAMFGSENAPVKQDHGFAVVIADRGHVWVGDCIRDGDILTITNARTIRRWGTIKGLGELVLGGPTEKTKLDPIGEVRVNWKAVIGVCPSERSRWSD